MFKAGGNEPGGFSRLLAQAPTEGAIA